MANLVQGGDYAFNITVKDSADVVIDLTTLAGYICVVYYANGDLLQKYSEQTKAGFKALTETDGANGIFQIKLQSIDTKNARLEEIFAEVKIETVDANYDSSTLHNPDTGISLGTIVKGITKDDSALT